MLRSADKKHSTCSIVSFDHVLALSACVVLVMLMLPDEVRGEVSESRTATSNRVSH